MAPAPSGEQRAAFGAEHDVLEHAQRWHQHEVLVHHADAAVIASRDERMRTGRPLTRISPESAS